MVFRLSMALRKSHAQMGLARNKLRRSVIRQWVKRFYTSFDRFINLISELARSLVSLFTAYNLFLFGVFEC